MDGNDLDLNRPDDNLLTPPPDRSSRTAWIVGGAFVVAVLVGGAVRWWTLDRQAPDQQPSAPAAVDVPAAPEAPAVVLPPMDQMDGFLRVLLATLSSRPELTNWLATDGLLQQMVVGIDRIAQGGTPARDLKVLAPTQPLGTRVTGRTLTLDPASFRRYDGLAETVASLDPDAVARTYRTIKPRLEEAYATLGKGASLDLSLAAAFDVLLRTPVPEGNIALVEGKGATWAFADPTLEALSPAQKQIVRMGPENARRVLDRLSEIRQALQQPE